MLEINRIGEILKDFGRAKTVKKVEFVWGMQFLAVLACQRSLNAFSTIDFNM